MITAEQLTIIRTSLDASAYQAGANVVAAANAQMAASGDQVVTATEKVTRAQLGVERQMESYRRATIDGYAEVSKFATIQDSLNRAMSLGRTTAAEATTIMGAYADKFGLVNNEARAAAQSIQNVQIQALAAADAMQRASQAQAAYNARSGSPGTSAPVGGAGYGASAGGGNPLYGDAYAARQADLDAYGAAMDSMRAKYVPMAAAQQRYEADLAAISEAVNIGAISEAEAAVARERVTQSYLDARDAVNAYAIAQRDAMALAGEQPAANAQAAYNARSGAMGSNPLYGAAYDARQSDISSAFADADKQRASVDELYASSKRYESVLEQIQALQATGVYNSTQAEAATARATEAYANQANMAGSLGLSIEKTNQTAVAGGHAMRGFAVGSSYATRELIVMGDEVLRGNYSRIPGSILVLTSHVAVLREGLIRLVTSFAGLASIGGLLAVGGMFAFSVAAEEDNRRIEALQNRLSLVRDDYKGAGQAADDAARKMAAATRDSKADSRVGASDLYANPAFQGTSADAAEITGTFYNLSKAMGEAETNWKRMSEAISDPAAVLKELQGHVKGVTTSLIEQVTQLENSGDKARAFALAYAAINAATKDVIPNESKLEEALRRVDGMFVSVDGHGKTLAHTLGDIGTQAATGAVYGFGLLIAELDKFDTKFNSMNDKIRTWLGVPEGGIFSGGSAPGGAPGAPQITSNANIDAQSQAMIHFQALQDHMSEAMETFTTHIAHVESGGHQFKSDGSVKTSSAGALGEMQVMPDSAFGDHTGSTTQRTVGGVSYDLTDTATNISAGMHIIAELFKQFNGDEYKVAQGYNAGPGVASGQVHQSAKNKAETDDYERKMGLVPGGSVPVQFGPPASMAGQVGQAASDSSSPGTHGVINAPDNTLSQALALTSGTTESNVVKLTADITLLNKALALPGTTVQDRAKLTQELQKATLELYNAVPASEALSRAAGIQTTAESKMAEATAQGAAAVARASATAKAEAEARNIAKEGTVEYNKIVAELISKNVALAVATQNVTLAQKTTANQDTLEYLKAEAGSFAMADEKRVVYLAHLKEQQAIEGKGTAEYRAEVLKTTDAVAAQTEALKNMGMTMEGGLINAWKEIGHSVNDTGDAFKSLATDSIKGAEDAFVSFVETGKLNMHDLVQSIETDMLKLATKILIEQPIMNALGGGGTGNVWTQMFGNGFSGASGGGAGGTTTSGSQIPGSTSLGSDNGAGASGVFGGLLSMGSKIAGLFGAGAGAMGAAGVGMGLMDAAPAAEMALGSSAGMASLVGDAAALFHSGGIVGSASASRQVPASTFYGAPRFHDGLGSDEFAAILQKGERVLTAKQDAAVTSQLKANTDGGSSGPNITNVHNWNITTPDVKGFQRSQAQVTAMVSRSAAFTSQRIGSK